ncbi:MAG: alpha/beta fold hydrolase BchO [Pseudomonadota bacterium]
MNWERVKHTWPNASASRFVSVAPHQWFVQETGTGGTVLLLHGAGGSSHSWRDVFPALADSFNVITIDLPGQGFTRLGAKSRCGIKDISADIETLLGEIEADSLQAIIGHSAGVAIALQLALNGNCCSNETRIIGINAALGHFKGLAGMLFPVLAKALSRAPFIPEVFAQTANADRLIASTGSKIDMAGMEQYRQLIADPDHVAATLAMMSQWHLDPLLAALPKINQKTLFLAGARDKTVPPDTSERAANRMPNATFECWEDFGHLIHEEVPEQIAARIRDFVLT